MSGVATFLGRPKGTWQGDARLYELQPPLDTGSGHTHHVVVSANTLPFSGPETYIFPASSEGEVTDWGELTGSTRGVLDHLEALRGAGYEVEGR